MGEELGPFPCEIYPPPEQIPGGAHLGGIARGLGDHATAQQEGNLVRIDPIVLGLAPVDRLHVQGVSQHAGNARMGAAVSQPVPSEDAFDADHHVLPVGRNRLEEWSRGCFHSSVQQDLSVLLQDAEVHGAGMQVDAARKLVRFGVESHEVSSS